MVTSRPALLSIPAEDLGARVEAFKFLLGGAENDLGTIFVEQPQLLLENVDDCLQKKVWNPLYVLYNVTTNPSVLCFTPSCGK